MITIVRRPRAPEMAAAAQAVTDQIVAYLKNRPGAVASPPTPGGEKQSKKDPDLAKLVAKYSDERLGLKKHLLGETFEKCAYCESFITHIDYGDIEHIVPKAVRPDLAVDLDNLTIACGVCNTNKSDYYSEKAPLVDPHVDDCRREIVFFGWGIAMSRCAARGRHTLRELELNRPALTKRREDHFNQLGELVSSYEKESDASMRYALLLTIWHCATPEAEYASMCMTALEDFKVEPLP